MTANDTAPTAAIPESREWLVIILLCVLAAVHVFAYSAAFPFFNNHDEECHFDLVVKYSQGDIPLGMERFSEESVSYLVYFGTYEYFPPEAGVIQTRPPWLLPGEQALEYLQKLRASARTSVNYESLQPPLYYAAMGACWRVGRALNLDGGSLLYGMRFLNMLAVAAMVCLGYLAARTVFPESQFIRLAVPALLAFLPQSAFYSIENDVLSPVCFGAVFVCLLRWMRGDALTFRLAIITGIALAAAFLTKISNVPFVAFAALAITIQTGRLISAGKWRSLVPGLAALIPCAALPAAAWMGWNKYKFGDLTGSAIKIQFLSWTHKPFADWWSHPIFTPTGLWTFVSGLFSSFWQGEMVWHGRPLSEPALVLVYTLMSLCVPLIALGGLFSRSNPLTREQRLGLLLGLGSVLAGVAFLGFLSIIFDFHTCVYPSPAHPFFTSGRFMLGAAVPFFLVFACGLDLALRCVKNRWVRPLTLAGLILFMLICELATNWPVFSSEFNWYHM